MATYDVAPLEGFHPEIGILLASLTDSTREWKDELGSPSIEAITWQPVPNFHSIGGLLLHIIEVEMYWFEQFVGQLPDNDEDYKLLKSEEIDQDAVMWPAPPAQPIEWYYEIFERIRKRSWEALRNEDPARLIQSRRGDEMSVRWVIAHVVEHDSYHGGQAVLLHELYKKMGQK